jgi:hypothetical protein
MVLYQSLASDSHERVELFFAVIADEKQTTSRVEAA